MRTSRTPYADPSIPLIEIRVFMLRRGWNQVITASKLGLSKQYFGDILAGRRKALHVRARMAAELGFPEELVAWRPAERRRAA